MTKPFSMPELLARVRVASAPPRRGHDRRRRQSVLGVVYANQIRMKLRTSATFRMSTFLVGIETRPSRWQFAPGRPTLTCVIRARGAASISMGRTPHEVTDEMCRAALGRRPGSLTLSATPASGSLLVPRGCRSARPGTLLSRGVSDDRHHRTPDHLPSTPRSADELDRFEDGVRRYLAGELDDDVFRVFRLNQGIYGQRQGGHNQMVRVKIPYGTRRARPARDARLHRRDVLARLGPPHHAPERAVPLRRSSSRRREVLRLLASVGLTSREACGDTVRNVAGCHLAGACPYEVLDISPWAEAAKDLFLRNPIAQRLPRKFKINFSGCATDCGQAMFNDVGVIAREPPAARRHASSPASGCSSPAASAPTRTRRRRSRSSRRARTCCRRSRRSCAS